MKIVFQKARIVKSVRIHFYWWVCNNALSMLEPYEVKVSRAACRAKVPNNMDGGGFLGGLGVVTSPGYPTTGYHLADSTIWFVEEVL